MRIVDKRQTQEPSSESGKSSEGSADGELQRQEAALDPTVLDGIIKRPQLGERFYVQDVEFLVVDVVPAGLVIAPVGVSARARKLIRRAMARAK